MQKKISIIMGIYNCADTLPEAIQSILQQTYRDWELIMFDDGSTDDTHKVASEFANQYENIFLYQNERNMGLNYTLNKCLEKVHGQYIARMDGDDISMPTRLEKEVLFLETHKNYAFVSTPMIYFDEKGDWGKGKAIRFPTKDDFIKGTPFCHAPCLVRKEAYDAVNGYSVERRLLRMEDYHLWIKMYAQGYIGSNLDEPLYKMRDDRAATKRRAYKYRINEAYVRLLAIKMLGLSKVGYIYVLRPLVLGLMPTFIYEYLHRKRMKKMG